ncbi:hypothetical protein MTO96_008736 [Rhipicephalus appendiculatus]
MTSRSSFARVRASNLAQYNDGELRAAVVANSGLHSAVAEEDLVCTNLPKNIFTVSTSCADRVANYAKIRELTLRGNKLAFHAYIAPPGRGTARNHLPRLEW